MDKTSKQIAEQHATVIGEAEQILHKRAAEKTLTEEEATRLEELLGQAEQLKADLFAAQATEQVERHKRTMNEPLRAAPAIHVAKTPQTNQRDGLKLWLQSQFGNAHLTTQDHRRAQEAGFELRSLSADIPCNYGYSLNAKDRAKYRTIYTTGSNLGAEVMPQTYSSLITERIVYESPFLSVLSSEVTSDGNPRDYFILDDTANASTRVTASAGTEINPTIPDKDVATDAKTISVFTITSGYQKLTWEATQDNAVNLEAKVANWIAKRHARFLENEVINGTSTMDGLLEVDSSIGTTSAWDADALDDLYNSLPVQYRANAVFLCSSTTAGEIRKGLKDSTNRTLFDRSIEDTVEFNVLMGRKFFESAYMPDDVLLFFAPEFYMLRLVEGQRLDVLREKYHPHVAYCGLMRCGMGWLGASNTCKSLTFEEASS